MKYTHSNDNPNRDLDFDVDIDMNLLQRAEVNFMCIQKCGFQDLRYDNRMKNTNLKTEKMSIECFKDC